MDRKLLKAINPPLVFIMLSKSAFDIARTNRQPIDQQKGYAQDAFNAQIQGINARTPAERVAAARAAAAAQNKNTPDDVRKLSESGAI